MLDLKNRIRYSLLILCACVVACLVLGVIFTNIQPEGPSELLVLGPLGANPLGFVLGLSGADSVLAQLQVNHLNHVLSHPHDKNVLHRQAGILGQIKSDRIDSGSHKKDVILDELSPSRTQKLSLSSSKDESRDADDLDHSAILWRHHKPDSNAFDDVKVTPCILLP